MDMENKKYDILEMLMMIEVNLGYKSFLQIRVARNCPKFLFLFFGG